MTVLPDGGPVIVRADIDKVRQIELPDAAPWEHPTAFRRLDEIAELIARRARLARCARQHFSLIRAAERRAPTGGQPLSAVRCGVWFVGPTGVAAFGCNLAPLPPVPPDAKDQDGAEDDRAADGGNRPRASLSAPSATSTAATLDRIQVVKGWLDANSETWTHSARGA
jgi:hypothetical protein